MPIDLLKAETHQALQSAIAINRQTLGVARETTEQLHLQTRQLAQLQDDVEVIDHHMDRADIKAGKINSCCGFGVFHSLKRIFTCSGGKAVKIREQNQKEISRAQKRADRAQFEPIYEASTAPALEDSTSHDLDVIDRQLQELRMDALYKAHELDLQNKMLTVVSAQTASAHVQMNRTTRYVGKID